MTTETNTHIFENPMGTNGFAFLEFATAEPEVLTKQFENLGFREVARHPDKDIRCFNQGNIHFFINVQPGYAARFAEAHGPSTCAMGFRVKNAQAAYDRALSMNAKSFTPNADNIDDSLPAIYGIGGSIIYFIDDQGANRIHKELFIPTGEYPFVGQGLQELDHVTHNVQRGEMDTWAGFYERLFNFREIRYFDIEGQHTGLVSRAMTSPCGNIRIPINESSDDKSQIEEFLKDFNGEGIQHIALTTDNIYKTIPGLRNQSIKSLDTPDTYYKGVAARVPWHEEDLALLQEHKIILDGGKTPEAGLLLQIFTEAMLGPVFFEVIQRKGDEGFGEGNFKALFESMELDQIERGTLKVD